MNYLIIPPPPASRKWRRKTQLGASANRASTAKRPPPENGRARSPSGPKRHANAAASARRPYQSFATSATAPGGASRPGEPPTCCCTLAVTARLESAVRNAVYRLNVKPEAWTYELLLRMKERFGVSAEAFAIRLKELALITRRKSDVFINQIKQHYESTDHDEPMAKERRPGKAYDLAALSL